MKIRKDDCRIHLLKCEGNFIKLKVYIRDENYDWFERVVRIKKSTLKKVGG